MGACLRKPTFLTGQKGGKARKNNRVKNREGKEEKEKIKS